MHVKLSASFNQFLSHIVLICICLTSFILWPDSHLLIFNLFYWLVLTISVVFFGWHLFKLKSWQYDFDLSGTGDGQLNKAVFKLWRAPVVTIFASVLFIEFDSIGAELKQRKVLIVWSDMLTDQHYRQLCRFLVKQRRDENN